jgi:ketosteroid isomerase-like protein
MTGQDTDRSTAEATERAFYAAFAACDPAAMATVWGDDDVVCIHPRGPAVKGRKAVLRTWDQILGAADGISLRVVTLGRNERDGLAVHVVEEHIGSGDGASLVLATNVYRRGTDGWRLVGHHASVPPAMPHRGPLQ